MSDREEKTGKNDNGKKNKGGKRNKIVAIEMIILVLLIMAAAAIFIQKDKSVKEAAKIHDQKAEKTEQTSQDAQKENEIEEYLQLVENLKERRVRKRRLVIETRQFLTVVILRCNREFQSERQNSPMRKSCI